MLQPRLQPYRRGAQYPASVGRRAGRLAMLLLGALATLPAADVDEAAVHVVLERHCGSCHGPQLKRPKGNFGFVTDLARLAADNFYIVPGNLMQSELYRLLVTDDLDERMPPPNAPDSHALSQTELQLIEAWIMSLAEPAAAAEAPPPEPEAVSQPPPPPTDMPPAADRPARSLSASLGLAHMLVLHFPIALLLVALPAQLWSLWQHQTAPRSLDRYLLWSASLGAAAAVVTGLQAAAEYQAATVDMHRTLAWLTLIFSCSALACHERWRYRPHRGWRYAEASLLAAAAVAVAWTAHNGGRLVHDQLLFG